MGTASRAVRGDDVFEDIYCTWNCVITPYIE